MKEPTKLSFADNYGFINYSAWIEVAGKPVPVYNIKKSEDGRKMTGYIEAQEGKPFTINSEGRSDVGMVIKPFGDGQSWGGGHAIQPETHHGRRFTSKFSGFPVSSTVERDFVFSKLNLTDDVDLSVKDETFIKNLGTIQLKLYRVSNMVQQYHSGAGVGDTPVPSEKMIHEKAKKALVSHRTGLGASRHVASPTNSVAVYYLDPDHSPYQTFEFRYLSRALLEIKGFVPDSDILPEIPQETQTKDKKPNKRQQDQAAGSSSSANNKKLKSEPIKVNTREKKDKNGKTVIYIDSD